MLLNLDGTRDSNFVATATGMVSDQNPPGVQALALQANGRVVIGGKFTRVNGVVRRNLARLEADGRLDSTFDAGAGPTSSFDTFGYMVSALEVERDGQLFVAGPFTSINGKARAGLAKLQGDPMPYLRASSITGGNFQASVVANLGEVIDVLVSSDLVGWAPWITVTNETGTVPLSDVGQGTRFYRAMSR